MRNDARAHGVLSESSVSLHIHAHDRKGDRREERGERKGREGRVETSHHVVAYVTRGARGSAPIVAPSPVTTPDAMMSLTAIEHLDFEPERECEHPQHPLGMGHSGPAWALVEVIHLCASPSRTLVYICRGGWDGAGARGTRCQRCGENLTRDQSWRIVQVLR